MLRFILVIIINLPLCVYFYFKAKRALKKSDEERFRAVKWIIHLICKKIRATVESYGEENLPEKDGYALLINHQGRFDGLAVIESSSRRVSFLADANRSNFPVQKTVVDALGCVRIDKTSLARTREALDKLRESLKSGLNIAVFPEGIYGDNKNTLQEFKTGAIGTIMEAGCPIVPVCLYDTYKVYGVNSLKKVSCQVHYLTPITYDEYKDLTKSELAELVKQRIGEKIAEIDGKNK